MTSASPTGWRPITSTCWIRAAALAPTLPRCSVESAPISRGRLGALTGARVKQAATERVFGFEIMPAPFVVAHLQVGLTMQALDAAAFRRRRRTRGIYLTNALTGWEPTVQKPLPFPELEEERDARPGEAGLPDTRDTGQSALQRLRGHGVDENVNFRPLTGPPNGCGVLRPGLNDLYVRFFRMAERRIARRRPRRVVCFISNYSWLDGLSFTGMRERYWRHSMLSASTVSTATSTRLASRRLTATETPASSRHRRPRLAFKLAPRSPLWCARSTMSEACENRFPQPVGPSQARGFGVRQRIEGRLSCMTASSRACGSAYLSHQWPSATGGMLGLLCPICFPFRFQASRRVETRS